MGKKLERCLEVRSVEDVGVSMAFVQCVFLAFFSV